MYRKSLLLAVIMGSRLLSGWQTQPQLIKPLTVCEVSSNPKPYLGRRVAILGRLDCGHSLIDNSCKLVEYKCRAGVSEIFMGDLNEKQIEKAGHELQVDESALRAKLRAVRLSTPLGNHQEPAFAQKDNGLTFTGMQPVKDTWAMVYGTLRRIPKDPSECNKDKCDDSETKLYLVVLPNGSREIEDDDPRYPK